MRITEEQPDLITVRVQDMLELTAEFADLYVMVKGSSFFMGDAALNKAREVNHMVEALRQIGMPEADIYLQDVVAEASSGMLGRSSSASYYLKIHCARLELLPDALGVITSQKNSSLRATVWGYAREMEQREALLDSVLESLKRKAQRIADGMGVRLLGLYRFTEEVEDREARSQSQESGSEALSFGRSRAKVLQLDLTPNHGKRIYIRVEAHFRISGFDASGEA